MSLQFEAPIEAYIAVVLAMTSADDDFSTAEFQSHFEVLSQTPAFQAHDDEAISEHWRNTTQTFYGTFSDESGFSAAQMDMLATAVKQVVPADQYETVYAVAVQTAYADELGVHEKKLLDQLQQSLGLDATTAQRLQAEAGAQ